MWGKEDFWFFFPELSSDVLVLVLAVMHSFSCNFDLISSLLISAVFVLVAVVVDEVVDVVVDEIVDVVVVA